MHAACDPPPDESHGAHGVPDYWCRSGHMLFGHVDSGKDGPLDKVFLSACGVTVI
jgi:hypothetical protein